MALSLAGTFGGEVWRETVPSTGWNRLVLAGMSGAGEALVHPACSPGGTGEKLLPSCLLVFLQKA